MYESTYSLLGRQGRRIRQESTRRKRDMPEGLAFVASESGPNVLSLHANVGGVILIVGIDLPSGLTQRLQTAGLTVSRSRTAEDAGHFVSDRIPVAVLLPPCPGPDPYRVVRLLRSQERLAFVQVFMFAVNSEGFRMGDAIAAGVDDIFDVLDTSCRQNEETANRIIGRIVRSQSLAQLALLDPLTELHNRRFLNDRLPAEIARAARRGTTVSIALVDLDDFKGLNDTFGHTAGDRALRAFAQALRSGLRAYDVVCRFGGDEFVVLFPDCDAAGARAALAKLRTHRAWALSDLPVVTFSAGIAQFPDDGTSWATLFEVADRNVRLAKEGGRSCPIVRSRRTAS